MLIRITLIPAWISNHMPSRVWDEITCPFQNFNSCIVGVWERIISSHTFLNECNYLPMLVFKLNHISKRVSNNILVVADKK